MIGGRKTHSYPLGKPRPLLFVSIAMLAVVLAWVFLVPGHWYRAIPVLAAFLCVAYVGERLHRRYEKTGQAVQIPRPPRKVVRFPDGLPRAMMGARLAFFVAVAVMLVFGFAPMPELTARHGIIGCIFALIAVAIVNISLEQHCVKVRRAIEVETSRKPDEAGTPY